MEMIEHPQEFTPPRDAFVNSRYIRSLRDRTMDLDVCFGMTVALM